MAWMIAAPRQPLRALLVAMLLSLCGPPAQAATALAADVYLLPGRFVPGVQPDGNTVVLAAPDGLVVVDSGRHAAHAQAIVEFARDAGQPVAVIVNTHWHLDHIGGNARLRQHYPQLQVHASAALAQARRGFLADYRGQLAAMIEQGGDAAALAPLRTEAALIDDADRLAPDAVVDASGARSLAGRSFALHLETAAVTAGDLWLLEARSRILVAGDLVTLPVPFFDTACPARWSEALAGIAAAEFDTLVPGHGAPMRRDQFERYRRAYDGLLACTASSVAKTACIDGWIADLGPLLAAAEHDFSRRLLDYYIDQHLRAPPEHAQRYCRAG